MQFENLVIRLVRKEEEAKYIQLMQAHHYLGHLPKIGRCLWYVAVNEGNWIALIGFSAAALKCKARDQWIGWDYRKQNLNLKLVANNSRFLILPGYHVTNLASHLLSRCLRRLSKDWECHFGYRVFLVETFVDPTRFQGTIYRAANWQNLGSTKGFRRIQGGYSENTGQPKWIFVKALHKHTRSILSRFHANHQHGKREMKLQSKHMESLPDFFCTITDPRRSQGRRHRLKCVLALAVAATLCGMKSYKAMADWVKSLGQTNRKHFCCTYAKGKYIVPSESIIRDVLVRVDPAQLDDALRRWNEVYSIDDDSLAIDGKTMRASIDQAGKQVQIMSAIGHQSRLCHTQKKSDSSPQGEITISKNRQTKSKLHRSYSNYLI